MYLKVLITNDDGVNSPGLWAAAQAMAQAMMEPGEIFVVAPDRDQSGVGTSLTLRSPLRVREILPAVGGGGASVRAFSVEGTPGDATVLALESLVGPVDLVVSGINNGSNLGEDVLISGTVGAALQGYVRGYPSVAVSVGAVTDTPYDVAAAFLGVLSRELANGLSLPVSLMNVNVPNRPAGEIAGIRVTKLGRRSYTESVTLLEHDKRPYYWLSRDKKSSQEHPENTDVWALENSFISITPIHTGLTDEGSIPVMEGLFGDYWRRALARGS